MCLGVGVEGEVGAFLKTLVMHESFKYGHNLRGQPLATLKVLDVTFEVRIRGWGRRMTMERSK